MNWIFGGNKVWVFYSIRILLGFLCSLGETLFIAGVRRFFGHATSTILFLLLLCSSGMYTASTSFVNSTLAMISVFFSYGIWMRYDNHFLGLLIGAAAVIYDWPFVSIVLGIDLAVNYHFTHKLTIPAINIVLYNVLGVGGSSEVSLSNPPEF